MKRMAQFDKISLEKPLKACDFNDIDDEQNAKSIRVGGFGGTDMKIVDNVLWDKDNPCSPAD